MLHECVPANASGPVPAGPAGQLDRIRRLVATNLLLGVLTVAVATVGRSF
jgi:uncharacterized membrane protein